MSNFDEAFKRTLGFEGTYSFDPDDRGGETCYGISRKYNSDWAGWPLVDKKKANSLNIIELKKAVLDDGPILNLAKARYKKEYWDKLKCEFIKSTLVSHELFDTAVNMGVRTSSRFLQTAINLLLRDGVIAEDGFIGKKTLTALNVVTHDEIGEKAIYTAMRGEQYLRYKELVARDPSQKKYIRGWLKRV